MEALWACLLVAAFLRREMRPLGLLLAFKWSLNYAAFGVAEWAPVFVDMALGTVGIVWATAKRAVWADVISGAFVLTAIVHASYWVVWPSSDASDAWSYYFMVIGLFTAQALAAAWPGIREGGQRVIRWVVGLSRWCLAGLAAGRPSVGRPRPSAQ